MTNAKQEAKAALLALKEIVIRPVLTVLDRKTAATYIDHALENLEKLSVARPRKNGGAG